MKNPIKVLKSDGSFVQAQTAYSARLSFGSYDPYWSNVVLLAKLTGTNGSTTFTDEKSHTLTANGNAAISTAINDPFGNNSGVLALDGTGDYVGSADSADWDFGTGDFTIDTWLYNTALTTGTNRGLWDSGWNGAGSNLLILASADNKLAWYANGHTSTNAVTTNTWQHIAVCKNSGTLRIFLNGVLEASGSDSENYTTTNAIRIGNYSLSGTGPTGYMSYFRVTKGVGRWTETFAVPSLNSYTTR